MSFPETVLREIGLRVACGFDNRDSLLLHIFETMGDEFAPEITRLDQLDPKARSALEEAIEQAFARLEREALAWPPVTDCDRLKTAFEKLDEQGIVALASCGMTQQDGRLRAVHVAIVRDELGKVANDGYCFFHDQDTIGAVEGGGLYLAFGSFKESEEANSEHALTVGQTVVRACGESGLPVEWNGSPSKRIRLPAFRWQRRLIYASELDTRDFLESWEMEMRAGYTLVERISDVLWERASDWFGERADFGPRMLARLREHTESFLEMERAREGSWSTATINDRIIAAFADLRQHGILASECLGLTIQDGWGYVGVEATSGYRGAVFFHQEDVFDAMNGFGLLLAYGVLGVDASKEKEEEGNRVLGSEIVRVLQEHQVPCSWSGSVRERIRIAPFEWRRRRWTPAPTHERRIPGASEPLSSCVVDSTAATMPPDAETTAAARQLAVVVPAVRDESRFDVRRSKRMREAWKALGMRGEIQVGHLGIPHAFVRTGDCTTMLPQLAIDNVRGKPTG